MLQIRLPDLTDLANLQVAFLVTELPSKTKMENGGVQLSSTEMFRLCHAKGLRNVTSVTTLKRSMSKVSRLFRSKLKCSTMVTFSSEQKTQPTEIPAPTKYKNFNFGTRPLPSSLYQFIEKCEVAKKFIYCNVISDSELRLVIHHFSD